MNQLETTEVEQTKEYDQPKTGILLQRACACGGFPGVDGECEQCRKKRLSLKRNAAGIQQPSIIPPIVREVLRSPGQPLNQATRSLMESRFGHEFSRVRVHIDAKAAESASTVNASAFTVGQEIVFGEGQFAPWSSKGLQLLSHELIHTIQQRGARQTSAELKLAGPRDSSEQEANRASRLTNYGRFPPISIESSRIIARQPAEAEASKPACALSTFTASNFVGDEVRADSEFHDSLTDINSHAVKNDVQIHITHSFRKSGKKVSGAVVTPAEMSNHLVGHAIDMNVKYGAKKDKLCNSTCLGGDLSKDELKAVKGFIDAIRSDKGLRWGGDFKDKDPVHIDDNLNSDEKAWKERYKVTQEACEK